MLEPTKSGTELTISYTHTTLSIDMRRSDLQNRYHFTCNCGECSHGLTLDQPDLSLAVQLLSSSPIRPSFETEIASLLTKAKDLPAAEGLVLVAEAYQRCREHTDYPQWLSPLYQLRFDLIMGLQANKLWVAAFIQSMILHFKAQPIVHSQLSHPARVARGWIHAKMAGHIGGLANELDFASSVGAPDEGELAKSLGLEFGLDWGMVVYTLVKEVSDQVLKSHGLESRFSLEVGREMGKIKQEARDTRGEPIEEDLERTKAQLGAVANKGWDWWIQQMRDPQGSRMRLVQSSEPCTQNALSVLLE